MAASRLIPGIPARDADPAATDADFAVPAASTTVSDADNAFGAGGVNHGLKRFSVIGSGNVATALALALARVGEVREIYSRDIAHACELAGRIGSGCRAIDSLDSLSPDSDLYLISVVDDAIPAIVAATSYIDSGVWVHTSGSTPMSVFEGYGSNRKWGVFYPLQTFSKQKNYDISVVPLLIEGCDSDTRSRLMALAESVSGDVKPVDSPDRMRLHIAAVFACNFVNYMWTLSDDILRPAGMDVTVLMPLLIETLDKIKMMSPLDGQTGPARRDDKAIMEKHCSRLDGERLEVYKMLSRLICERYNGHS